jgi:hypothetical protein
MKIKEILDEIANISGKNKGKVLAKYKRCELLRNVVSDYILFCML